MYIFLAILYGIVGIFMFWCLVKKNKQNKIIGVYSGIVFGMIIYYIIVPILTMLNIDELSEQYIMVKTYICDKEMINYIYVLFLIVISFIFLEIGYQFKIRRRNKVKKVEKDDKETKEKKYILLKVVAWGTFCIGSICLFTFFHGLGGTIEAIKYGNTARTFYTSLANKMPNYIAILIIPARLVTVSPFLFLWLDSMKDKGSHKDEHKYIYKIFTVISFILAMLFFLYNAGKAPIICFLLSFFVAFCYKFTKKTWLILIPLAIVAMPMLDILDELFRFFQNGTWTDIKIDYLKYLNQFIYPFRTLLNLPQINMEYGLRWGKDFITAFLNLIPGLQFPVSYENISMFFGGENWKIKGGIPSDLITFFYTQFSLLGLPFFFMLLGWILRKIDEGLIKLNSNKYAMKLIQAILTIQFFLVVASADFESIIRGQFILIILSIMVILSNCKARKMKNKNRGESIENIICNSNSTRI